VKDRLLFLFFFASGATGLLYEIVWVKLFSYTIGGSSVALTAVVALFMAGLGLGAHLGGRLADRTAQPAVWYGRLLVALGLYAAAVPVLLEAVRPVLALVYRFHDGRPEASAFTLAALVAAAIILLPPTCAMGATLPLLTRQVGRTVERVGSSLGLLYGINTCGAVLGSLVSGFFLIPGLGLLGTTFLGAAIDIVIGAAVLLNWKGERIQSQVPPQPESAVSKPVASADSVRGAALLALSAVLLAGFADMTLQIAWTRALVLSVGTTTYAFTLILAVFILGLAAGSVAVSTLTDRVRSAELLLGGTLIAAGVLAASTVPRLGLLPPRLAVAAAHKAKVLSFGAFFSAAFWSTFWLLFPATFFMGAALAPAVRIVARKKRLIGKATGVTYAFNTVGSVAGTLACGFLLIPYLGALWRTIASASALLVLTGCVILLRPPKRALRLALTVSLLCALTGAAYLTRPYGALGEKDRDRPSWHPAIMNFAPYLHTQLGAAFGKAGDLIDFLLKRTEVLWSAEGRGATVAVIKDRLTGRLSLTIAGKTDASVGGGSLDMPTQLMLAHLPMLLHRSPENVFVLGLGGGITLGAVTLYPEAKRIEVAEISPLVVQAAQTFFAEANHRALEDPRVKVILGDARTHLTYTARRYDVITSQPSNFWIAGLGNLFTLRYYKILKSRLRPGGVICQWFQAAGLQRGDFLTALATFLEVFPHAALFSTGADVLVVGSLRPLGISPERVKRALSSEPLRGELASLGIEEPAHLVRYLRLWEEEIQRLPGLSRAGRHTDWLPVLEFSSPFGLFTSGLEVLTMLQAVNPGRVPDYLLPGEDSRRIRQLRAQSSLLLRLAVYSGAGNKEKLRELLAELGRTGDPFLIRTAVGRIRYLGYFAQASERLPLLLELVGSIPRGAPACQTAASELAQTALRLPDSPQKLEALELALEKLKRAPADLVFAALRIAVAQRAEERASRLWKKAERYREDWRYHFLSALKAGMAGRIGEAEASFNRALKAAPRSARHEIYYNLGWAAELRKQYLAASRLYRKAVETSARPSERYLTSLVRALRLAGERAQALKEAEKLRALLIKSKGSKAAWRELWLLYRETGDEAGRLEAELHLRR